MIIYPCCKINLGLNVISKRKDGYHNLETVFYPVPLCDTLEIKTMEEGFSSLANYDIKVTGNALIDCNEKDNLVVKAYHLLAKDFNLPRIHIYLHKKIPSQAGLGGGSADAAYMINLLNKYFCLGISNEKMQQYAAKLGADCAFFINAEVAFATGIGDKLTPIKAGVGSLKGHYLLLVKPDIAVSTAEAYANIKPQQPQECCRDIIFQPIEIWKNKLRNDFEKPVFIAHPELKVIKDKLYKEGALYAQMSGSGSTIFGIFKENPTEIGKIFQEHFVYICCL